MDRNIISRRDVLRCGVALGAAAACSSCVPGGSREADVVVPPQAGTLRLGETESAGLLEPDSSLLVRVEGRRDKILLIHTADTLYAVSSKCTHLGCTVAYEKESGRLLCPCHGSQYALDGSNLKGPAQRPLRRYDVHREQGQIIITL